MKTIFKLFVFSLFVVFSACSSDDNSGSSSQLPIDLPISGTYKWDFVIPDVAEQVSIHKFSNDKIEYIMEGSAYSNSYNMIPESYNATEKRIVAVGQGGETPFNKDEVYFVMFLKDITETTVTIYKKECTSKQEAYSFSLPNNDDIANHGWNVYEKQ